VRRRERGHGAADPDPPQHQWPADQALDAGASRPRTVRARARVGRRGSNRELRGLRRRDHDLHRPAGAPRAAPGPQLRKAWRSRAQGQALHAPREGWKLPTCRHDLPWRRAFPLHRARRGSSLEAGLLQDAGGPQEHHRTDGPARVRDLQRHALSGWALLGASGCALAGRRPRHKLSPLMFVVVAYGQLITHAP
jgi:hypothetical protein